MKKKYLIGLMALLLVSAVLALTMSSRTQLKPSASNTYYEFGSEYVGNNVTVNSTHIGIDGRYIKIENGNLLANITNIVNRSSDFKEFYFTFNNTGSFNLNSIPLNGNFLPFVDDCYFTGNSFNITSTSQEFSLKETNLSSYSGISLSIPDINISSTSYILIDSKQFNTSLDSTSFGLLMSTNIKKVGGGGSGEFYLKIVLDGVTLFDSLIRTLDAKNQAGVPAINPLFFNVSSGIHNLSFYGKIGGNGVIHFYNTDLSLGKFETTSGIAGRGNITNINSTFNSLSSVSIYDKTINRDFFANSYLSLALKVNASGQTDVICRFRDGGESPYFVVSISDKNVFRGVSTNYITEPPSNDDVLHLDCFSTQNEDVTLVGSFIEADLVDNVGNLINHCSDSNSLTNYTNTRVLSAGTHALVTKELSIVDGGNILFSASVSASSSSGSQTPSYFINVSGGENASNCLSIKERYHGNSDIGNIFFYPVCSGLEISQRYNFTLWVTVPAGETLVILDEALSLFENSLFDISSINVPPIVSISSPEFYNYLNSSQLITWNNFDVNNDATFQSINISNGVNFVDVEYLNGSINSYYLDTSSLSDGIYNLTIISVENNTLESFSGSDSVLVYLDSTAPDINFESPSTSEGDSYDEEIVLNLSLSDNIALKNITIYLYDDEFNLYSSYFSNIYGSSDLIYKSWSGLNQKTFYLNYTIYDNNSNLLVGDTRTYKLSSDPVASIGGGTPIINSVSDEENITVIDSDESIEIIELSLLDKTLSFISNNGGSELVVLAKSPAIEKFSKFKNYLLWIIISLLILGYLIFSFEIEGFSGIVTLFTIWIITTVLINLLILFIIYLGGILI